MNRGRWAREREKLWVIGWLEVLTCTGNNKGIHFQRKLACMRSSQDDRASLCSTHFSKMMTVMPSSKIVRPLSSSYQEWGDVDETPRFAIFAVFFINSCCASCWQLFQFSEHALLVFNLLIARLATSARFYQTCKWASRELAKRTFLLGVSFLSSASTSSIPSSLHKRFAARSTQKSMSMCLLITISAVIALLRGCFNFWFHLARMVWLSNRCSSASFLCSHIEWQRRPQLQGRVCHLSEQRQGAPNSGWWGSWGHISAVDCYTTRIADKVRNDRLLSSSICSDSRAALQFLEFF